VPLSDIETPSGWAVSIQETGTVPASPIAIGFTRIRVTVPRTQALGSATLAFGNYPAKMFFGVRVVRRGLVTNMQPANAVAGTSVNMRLDGDDIGDARVTVVNNTISNLSATDSRVTFTMKSSSASATKVNILAADGQGTQFRLGQFPFVPVFEYTSQTGIASCTSIPGLLAPTPQGPANGTVFDTAAHAVGTPLPTKTRVTLRWQPAQNGRKDAQGRPIDQHILEVKVSYPTLSGASTSRTGSTTIPSLATTTTDTLAAGVLSSTRDLNRPGTYSWRVRTVNCTQDSPWSASYAFTLK
jgi:hypothetical protein